MPSPTHSQACCGGWAPRACSSGRRSFYHRLHNGRCRGARPRQGVGSRPAAGKTRPGGGQAARGNTDSWHVARIDNPAVGAPRAARAAVQALDAWFRSGSHPGFTERDEWIRRANQHAAAGTAEGVFTAQYQGMRAMLTSRFEGRELMRQAVEQARRLGNDRVFMAGWTRSVLSSRSAGRPAGGGSCA